MRIVFLGYQRCLLVSTGRILALVACGLLARSIAAAQPVELLREYCGSCHCDGAAEGEIDLDALLAALPDIPPQDQPSRQPGSPSGGISSRRQCPRPMSPGQAHPSGWRS